METRMSKLAGLAVKAMLLAAVFDAAAAGHVEAPPPPGPWQGWFEQDGRKIPFAPAVRLKKQPFQMVFNGPAIQGYALVGSVERRDVADKANSSDITGLVRHSNILIEPRGRTNTELYLNAPSAFAALDNGTQLWTEEKEAERYSFQKFTVEADGSATATHEIARLCVKTDFRSAGRCAAIKDYPGGAFYLIVTGIAARSVTFSGPRFIAIEFE
jgi:hypothetical protein